MRIAIVDWYGHVVGGAEAYVRSILRPLLANGHAIAFVHGAEVPAGEAGLCTGIELPVWRFDEQNPADALDQLRGWRPDVVYVHSQRSHVLENELLKDFVVVLFAHNYYGTCGTGAKTFAFPRIEPCERTFGPACVALHYVRRCGGLNPVVTVQTHRQQWARRKNLGRYRAIAVASCHMQAEFSKHGVAQDRLRLVPLPLSGSVRDANVPVPRRPQGRLLMVGRLTREKGCEFLIRAMPQAERLLSRRLALTVAGSGPERGSLERLAAEVGAKVTFAGWVGSERRTALMREADLLVVPSVWPEPFGLVGLEAGCVGLPAAAYGTGGITDWLAAGVTGEVAPAHPPTPDGLAAAIARALSDERHYNRLRHGAWARSGQSDMAAHVRALESMFSEALSETRSAARASLEQPSFV